MNNYRVVNSMHGPAVILGSDIVFLEEAKRLCPIVDEFPQLLFDITDATLAFFNDYMNFFVEGFKARMMMDTGPVHTAINVMGHYNNFIYGEYPHYREDIAMAMTGDSSKESVIRNNPELVNKFYGFV